MKSLRKVLSCALALTIAAGMFAMPAAADETEEQAVVAEATETPEVPESDAADITDGTFTITADGDLKKYTGVDINVTVPETIGGVTVKTIAQAFVGNTKIKTVTLPDTVEELKATLYGANGSFKGCTALRTVNFGKGIKTFGENAFTGCTSLQTFVIPDTVTSLGNKTFLNCTSLASVTIGSGLSALPDRTFSGCTSLVSVTVPNNIKTIGVCCFSGCSKLVRITLPSNLTSIGNCAFVNCTNLKEINLPGKLTNLGEECFSGCSSLVTIDIPGSVDEVGWDAFRNCTSLENVTLNEGITTIGRTAFGWCEALKVIKIPNSVTSIGDHAFMCCSVLDEAYIGYGMKSIGAADIFASCGVLKTLHLDKNLISVSESFCNGAPNLETIHYTGTKAQWNQFIEDNDTTALYSLKPNITVYCTDGIIPGAKYKTVEKITASLDYGYTINVGDDLNLTKIRIDVEYSNKTSTTINASAEGVTVKGYDKTKSGKQTLTITYEGKSTTLTIDVKGSAVTPTMQAISARLAEGYTIYKGDELDKAKILITVTYTDGSATALLGSDTGVTITGYSKTKVGDQTLTIKYSGKTTTLVITVLDKGAPVLNDDITLDGEAVASYEAAIKSIGNKTGEFTLTINAPITVSKFTFPKNAKFEIIATENGSITTTATSLAPSAPLVIECPITNSKGKDVSINAKSDLTLTGGTFGNVSVGGKAALTGVTINGNLALKAKADKSGLTTDTLENVTVAKKITSNNNVEFIDCPSIGTVNVKGLVTINGDGTKAVAVTSGAKTGTCTIEGLEVEKKLSVAADLSAYNLTANNAVDVKGNAVIEQSDIAGKLAVAKNLTAEGIGVKSAVDVKGNAVIDFSSIIGKLNVKGILTVNSDVRVENAVTCAELNSTKGAELTAMSLAVTKNGVSAESGEITLTLIDKFGGEVTPTPDKKGVITVSKKFKDSKTKAKEFDVPALKFNNGGTICPLKCVNGKLVVSA